MLFGYECLPKIFIRYFFIRKDTDIELVIPKLAISLSGTLLIEETAIITALAS